MKYFYLSVFLSIFTLNAKASLVETLTQSQQTDKLQVSLQTVMNPNGVTQEEWQAMFEGERCSIKTNIKPLNKFIEIFNEYFKNCSPELLECHADAYKERFNQELSLYVAPITNISLESTEDVKSYFNFVQTIARKRLYLLCTISDIFNSDISPLNTTGTACRILLNSFKTPLTPIQFACAGMVHQKGIKGAGAKVVVIEGDLVSEHSFLTNNTQVKIDVLSKGSYDKKHGGHGAHVTGIVHQIAPGADLFVYESIEQFNKNPPSTLTTPKIINTSYAVPIPRFHLTSQKQRIELRNILEEYKTFTGDELDIKLMNLLNLKLKGDNIQHKDDCLRYIIRHSGKPFQNTPEYETEIKAYETDYAGAVLTKAFQASREDANVTIQGDIDLFKGKLRIKSFGNEYNNANWIYYSLPSSVLNDEFLNQSILVININREYKLCSSSNRPDHTLNEILHHIMKERGVDDLTFITQQLQKIQASSLSALGTNVWSTGAHDRYEWYTGTSMAAPMVAGVAALIEGEHPEFSVNKIRECLLNSANREFIIGSGQDAIHVVDLPQDLVAMMNQDNGDSRKYQAFDPSQYGKGILDAEAALKYAEFKSVNRSASVDELVTMLSFWKRQQQ